MMSSWGASAFGRRLCLSYEMKKEQKKRERVGGRGGGRKGGGLEREKKKRKGGGRKLETPGGTSSPHCEDLPNSLTRGFYIFPRNTEGYNHRSKQITYL